MSESSIRMCTVAGPDSSDYDSHVPATSKLARLALGLLFVLGMLGLGACPPPEEDPPENGNDEEGVTPCTFDHADSAADAELLVDGQQTSGFLCPEGDEDWFRIEVSAARPLVSIELEMDGPISPVSPTYVVRRDLDGEVGDVVASPPATATSGVHSDLYCLDEGQYFIVVRDRGGQAEDRRHPYLLTVSTSLHPDPAPRTEGPEDARSLSPGQAAQGWVACHGETNWWSFDVPARRIARVMLDREPGDWAPLLKLHHPEDGVLIEASDPSGPVAATSIERLAVLPDAGTYLIEVSAMDDHSADPEVVYTLDVELIEDLDPNEPNDTPQEATPLPLRSCQLDWSDEAVSTGTFGVPGDQDWFRLPLEGCDVGVLEAVVELDTSSLTNQEAWLLQESLQASISLVRPHPASSCESSADCALLQQACNSDWDCAGYGNLCQGGRCSGAFACLQEGFCGATMVQRSYQRAALPEQITGPPPPNRAVLSVPLYGDDYVYLNVSDWQADGAAPELLYTLTVRVRTDPDTNEPSNLFVPDRERSDSIRPQLEAARARGPIPVLDCTEGDCCGPDTWIEGAISYELDEDFYPYAHPCPGEDCMLRIHYELDSGPVDFLFSVFRGNSLWFDTVIDVEERTVQPARSGTFGGIGEDDDCFYAFQGHPEGLHYTISVRDLAEHRDWDPDQRYRFCIEKVANECVEPPCRIYDDGCGT